MSISFELPDEIRDMADVVHKLAADEVRPHLRDHEHDGRVSPELCQQLHGLGLTTLALPAEAGGPGLDLRGACVLWEEVAWGDVGIAAAVPGARGAGVAIGLVGSAEQKERLLKPFAADDAHEKRGALALVEGPFGLTPDAISCAAEKRGAGFALSGEKKYVLFGGEADLTVVLARDATKDDPDPWKTLAFFAVEGKPSGLTATRHRTLGLNTASYSSLKLEGVAAERLQGSGDARRDVLEIAARLRVLDAARLVGCMRAASEYAFKYSTERKAFGKALYEHQALAFMMADMATRVDACRWLVWRAAWRLDTVGAEGNPLEAALHDAVVAHRHASELAVLVTTDAVQVLGGHGYIQDHPVEKWMRDARCLGLVDGLSVDDDATIAENVVGS